VRTQVIGGIIVLVGIALVRTDEIRARTSSPRSSRSTDRVDELAPGPS
jgi:hypothetical protein